MYVYESTDHQRQRIDQQRDHCGKRVPHAPCYPLASVQSDGLLRDPTTGTLLTSCPISNSADPTATKDGLEVYIYAVSQSMEIRISVDGVRGTLNAVKHESLFDNESVLAAGEIWIEHGIVKDINDHSGTYLCRGELRSTPAFANAVLNALERSTLRTAQPLLNLLRRLSKPGIIS